MSEEAKSINKSAIKSFAIEARNILIKSATTEAGLYGISEDEIRTPIQKGPDFEVYETLAGTEKRIYRADMRRRENLVKAIQEKGFQEVIEETAYTWFNRLIAIRFMEVNDYLPTRTRVLSSETGNNTPDLINDFLDVDLGMTDEELQAVQSAKNENRYDDAFCMLFIKECNSLNDILPGLFEKTDDYMELLLNMPYTSDGVVRMLIDDIPEENFNVEKEGQVEIIGWLYQYYNTEPKAKAFAKKGKVSKEELPAVTQLFTPDWIVRFMVENSIGRYWIDSHCSSNLRDEFDYFLDEVDQDEKVKSSLAQINTNKISVEDIKVIDPCMGSGHILVCIFDLLMLIYKEEGYTERESAELILQNNLYGLDVDDRAYQLAYFAVMMKARQYSRNVLKKHPDCHIYSIQSSATINKKHLEYLGSSLSESEKNDARNQILGLIDAFLDAKDIGSLTKCDDYNWSLLLRFIEEDNTIGQLSFDSLGIETTKEKLRNLIEVGKVLNQKYQSIITNPPYMGSSNMNARLNDFIVKNYPEEKSDLFAAFIKFGNQMVVDGGYNSMVTMQSWMFLSSFEKMRKSILAESTVIAGLHMDNMVMGIAFGTAATVLRKVQLDDYVAKYCFVKYEDLVNDKPKEFPVINERLSEVAQKQFEKIPGSPIAYWISDNFVRLFSGKYNFKKLASAKAGLSTTNNEKFLRLWHEVEFNKIGFSYRTLDETEDGLYRYIPQPKGGAYKKWYGNLNYVVNWYRNGEDIRKAAEGASGGRIVGSEFYFRKGLTWSDLTSSGKISVRYMPEGMIFNSSAPSCFCNDDADIFYVLAFMNSVVANEYLKFLAPTFHFNAGPIEKLPLIKDDEIYDEISTLSKENVELTKQEWDMHEYSWNFSNSPMVCGRESMEESFRIINEKVSNIKNKIVENETRINTLFVEKLGLQKEINVEENKPEVAIGEYSREKAVKEFISYAIGCIFGRYSLDESGLIYAGGDWDCSKYKTFVPDEDAIIPITDDDYFKDDVVKRVIEFIKVVYGDKELSQNLAFIASALGNKYDDPEDCLRDYFVNDFYKDHCDLFSITGSGKRPIYWQFDSGKLNGFKALIYIHRYNPDTVGLIRSIYLHKVQSAIENALQNAEYVISTSSSATEKAAASKKRDKYVKQLNELRPYYQALSHVALKRIDMDLDDGVKANYQLFQGVEISTEGKKKQKIDLLAKI